MMVWSINLIILSIVLFIVGMINPRWLLFWMDKPGRLPIVLLTSAIFMGAGVMFGEATQEKQQAAYVVEADTDKSVDDVPPVAEGEAKKNQSE